MLEVYKVKLGIEYAQIDKFNNNLEKKENRKSKVTSPPPASPCNFGVIGRFWSNIKLIKDNVEFVHLEEEVIYNYGKELTLFVKEEDKSSIIDEQCFDYLDDFKIMLRNHNGGCYGTGCFSVTRYTEEQLVGIHITMPDKARLEWLTSKFKNGDTIANILQSVFLRVEQIFSLYPKKPENFNVDFKLQVINNSAKITLRDGVITKKSPCGRVKSINCIKAIVDNTVSKLKNQMKTRRTNNYETRD